MVVVPTRLVPGTLLGAAFACVGLETGLLTSALLHARVAIPTHWACLPLFAVALLYVRHIWREGVHKHPVRRITALPPRLQAVIFSMCLVIGLGAGAMLVIETVRGL